MGRRGKRKEDQYDCYYFGIEKTARAYHFGVNYSSRANPGEPYLEFNSVTLEGGTRHISDHVPAKRRYGLVTLKLYASREEENANQERPSIGFAEARQGVLHCYVWIPLPPFASLLPSLEAGRFKEVMVRVKNFRYRQGPIDGLDMNSEHTPDDDLC